MSGPQRALNMPGYARIVAECACACLNNSEYARIYLNRPEWLLFYISPL